MGALSVFPQTAPKPVPSDWLKNGKLVAADFNFSARSPSPDSHWTYMQLPDIQGSKAAAFIVDASKDTKFLIAVLGMSAEGGLASGTKEFIDGTAKSLPKGSRIDDVKIEPSDFPFKTSSKFKVKVRFANESTLYAYGYALTGSHLYMLVNYSPETTEPPQFTSFVGSFSFLRPEQQNSLPSAPNPIGGILLILAIVGTVADWRYKRRGGVKPTRKDYAFLIATLVVCAAVIGAMALFFNPYAAGTSTGILIPLVFALWQFSRLRIRMKHPAMQLQPVS